MTLYPHMHPQVWWHSWDEVCYGSLTVSSDTQELCQLALLRFTKLRSFLPLHSAIHFMLMLGDGGLQGEIGCAGFPLLLAVWFHWSEFMHEQLGSGWERSAATILCTTGSSGRSLQDTVMPPLVFAAHGRTRSELQDFGSCRFVQVHAGRAPTKKISD